MSKETPKETPEENKPISIYGDVESLGVEQITSYPNSGVEKYFVKLSLTIDSNNPNDTSTKYQTTIGEQRVYISKEQYEELSKRIAEKSATLRDKNIRVSFKSDLEFKLNGITIN